MRLICSGILLLLMLAAVPAFAEPAHLLHVKDADSIIVEMHGYPVEVRLLGIDAPEGRQEWGKEAKEFVKAWTANGLLELEFDRDKMDRYYRLLAWVWCDGKLLSEELVAEGLALPYMLKKSSKHYKRIHAALARAKEVKAGFWAQGGLAQTPHEWRKGNQ